MCSIASFLSGGAYEILLLGMILEVHHSIQLPAQSQTVQHCCHKLGDGFVPIALRSGFEKHLYYERLASWVMLRHCDQADVSY